uniref:Uncharacterized protein n=1 Tax=Cacopsylla melanoneura TaxID=428564 RepID=A0A8D8QT25_9HEMI
MIFLLLNIRVGGYTSVLATLYRRNTISDDLKFIFLIYKIRKIMRNPKHQGRKTDSVDFFLFFLLLQKISSQCDWLSFELLLSHGKKDLLKRGRGVLFQPNERFLRQMRSNCEKEFIT